MTVATLTWSEHEAPLATDSANVLLARVQNLLRESVGPVATIMTVRAHGAEMAFGAGPDGCFLQFRAVSGEPPYYVTLGDDRADGTVEFLMLGAHHTQIPRRFLIAWSAALQAVREFLETGRRPSGVSWLEV